MAEIKQITRITTAPGCRRDGTVMDGDNYTSVQWTRFQRGKPKKMGGFQKVTNLIPGPVSKVISWSKQQVINLFTFNPNGCSLTVLNDSGMGGVTYDRSPERVFTETTTLPASGIFYGPAWDGTEWVAVVYNTNKCVTSPDGVTWTERATMPSSALWKAVVWDGTYLIATSNGTAAATSNDHGVTWVARTLSSSHDWSQLATNGTQVIAVSDGSGTSSVCSVSTDHGFTWTDRTLPSASDWVGPVWTGSVWITANNSGGANGAASSTNGTTWTALNGPENGLRGLAYSNGVICGTGDYVNSFYTSTDGNTWTRHQPFYQASSTEDLSLDMIFTVSTGFVSISSEDTLGNATARYAFSTDGEDWVLGTLAATAKWTGASFATSPGLIISQDTNGLFGTLSPWAPDTNYLWSADTLPDAAAGSIASVVLAVPTKTGTYIDDETESSVYWAVADGSTHFAAITDVNATASGGVVCLPPYAVYFGTSGRVTWSNANEPRNCTTGDAGTARVTSRKIVAGQQVRSGSGPSGLLWSLDAVIRMSYVGGDAIFKFQQLAGASTILSQNCVVEHDGIYFWPGVDRFLFTDGSQVKELPNDMNLNWFYDNINMSARQKVWGTKVPRYGEIWWFYPRGTATECSHAVIFNVREGLWYDCELPRNAGVPPQVFPRPLWTETNYKYLRIQYRVLNNLQSDDLPPGNPCAGEVSGFRGIVVSNEGDYGEGAIGYVTIRVDNGILPLIGENFIALDGGRNNMDIDGAITSYQILDALHVHEKGHDRIEEGVAYAIEASFETSDFGLPAGGFQLNQDQGVNRWTRVVRVEPDFLLSGKLRMTVVSKEFTQGVETESEQYTIEQGTEKVDMREQARLYRFKFVSNESDGHFEMGRVMIHTEPGDVRN